MSRHELAHPLLHAVHYMRLDVVQFLLEQGLHPGLRGSVLPYTGDGFVVSELQGITPLDLAERLMAQMAGSRKSKKKIALMAVQQCLLEARARLMAASTSGTGAAAASPTPSDAEISMTPANSAGHTPGSRRSDRSRGSSRASVTPRGKLSASKASPACGSLSTSAASQMRAGGTPVSTTEASTEAHAGTSPTVNLSAALQAAASGAPSPPLDTPPQTTVVSALPPTTQAVVLPAAPIASPPGTRPGSGSKPPRTVLPGVMTLPSSKSLSVVAAALAAAKAETAATAAAKAATAPVPSSTSAAPAAQAPPALVLVSVCQPIAAAAPVVSASPQPAPAPASSPAPAPVVVAAPVTKPAAKPAATAVRQPPPALPALITPSKAVFGGVSGGMPPPQASQAVPMAPPSTPRPPPTPMAVSTPDTPRPLVALVPALARPFSRGGGLSAQVAGTACGLLHPASLQPVSQGHMLALPVMQLELPPQTSQHCALLALLCAVAQLGPSAADVQSLQGAWAHFTSILQSHPQVITATVASLGEDVNTWAARCLLALASQGCLGSTQTTVQDAASAEASSQAPALPAVSQDNEGSSQHKSAASSALRGEHAALWGGILPPVLSGAPQLGGVDATQHDLGQFAASETHPGAHLLPPAQLSQGSALAAPPAEAPSHGVKRARANSTTGITALPGLAKAPDGMLRIQHSGALSSAVASPPLRMVLRPLQVLLRGVAGPTCADVMSERSAPLTGGVSSTSGWRMALHVLLQAEGLPVVLVQGHGALQQWHALAMTQLGAEKGDPALHLREGHAALSQALQGGSTLPFWPALPSWNAVSAQVHMQDRVQHQLRGVPEGGLALHLAPPPGVQGTQSNVAQHALLENLVQWAREWRPLFQHASVCSALAHARLALQQGVELQAAAKQSWSFSDQPYARPSLPTCLQPHAAPMFPRTPPLPNLGGVAPSGLTELLQGTFADSAAVSTPVVSASKSKRRSTRVTADSTGTLKQLSALEAAALKHWMAPAFTPGEDIPGAFDVCSDTAAAACAPTPLQLRLRQSLPWSPAQLPRPVTCAVLWCPLLLPVPVATLASAPSAQLQGKWDSMAKATSPALRSDAGSNEGEESSDGDSDEGSEGGVERPPLLDDDRVHPASVVASASALQMEWHFAEATQLAAETRGDVATVAARSWRQHRRQMGGSCASGTLPSWPTLPGGVAPSLPDVALQNTWLVRADSPPSDGPQGGSPGELHIQGPVQRAGAQAGTQAWRQAFPLVQYVRAALGHVLLPWSAALLGHGAAGGVHPPTPVPVTVLWRLPALPGGNVSCKKGNVAVEGGMSDVMQRAVRCSRVRSEAAAAAAAAWHAALVTAVTGEGLQDMAGLPYALQLVQPPVQWSPGGGHTCLWSPPRGVRCPGVQVWLGADGDAWAVAHMQAAPRVLEWARQRKGVNANTDFAGSVPAVGGGATGALREIANAALPPKKRRR